MGRHTGERSRATTAPKPPRRRILVLSLLVTVTLVAWGVLVLAAIDFGRQARTGEATGWAFLGLAAAGATACLLVTLILGARLVATVRGQQPAPQPPRIPGGRRAAR